MFYPDPYFSCFVTDLLNVKYCRTVQYRVCTNRECNSHSAYYDLSNALFWSTSTSVSRSSNKLGDWV